MPQPGTVVSGANGLGAAAQPGISACRPAGRGRPASQVGGQHLPGNRGVRVGSASRAAATSRSATVRRTQAAGRGEPDEPALPSRREPGGVGEFGRDQPTDLGGQHVRQASVRPGKVRSSWPSNWFFVAVRSTTRTVRCADHAVSSPSTSERSLTGWPRLASSSSVITCRSITSVLIVRLPNTRRCSVNMAGVELQDLPPDRPRPSHQQRPVVVTGRFGRVSLLVTLTAALLPWSRSILFDAVPNDC